MPDALHYLEMMTTLAAFTAAGPETITMAMESTNIVQATRLTGLSSVDNQIEVADGIANISAENPDFDAVFTVEFDAAGNILELRNLANGESQGIDIGGTALSAGETQDVLFNSFGVTVTLNSDFDRTDDIQAVGGSASASAGSTGVISEESFEITAATEGVILSLSSLSGEIVTTSASTSIITVDGFSGTADLERVGAKSVTLTDGTDSFDLDFLVTTGMNFNNNFSIEISGLGTLFAIDRPSESVITVSESGGTLNGSVNGDKLAGAGGDDIIRALGGDDTIFGLAGTDSYDGGAGTDTLDLSDATTGTVARLDLDAVRNADGDRASLTGIENVTGSNFDDILVGDEGANRLLGCSGDDQLVGLAGDNQLFGNTGDDVLRGGAGDDILNGSTGQDTLLGEAGEDVLRGGAGNDKISGGGGSDHIIGGADADVIEGGSGFDRIFGGTGTDVFVMTDGFGYNRIFDFEDGVDRLNFADHASVSSIADLTIHTFNLGADTRIDVAADEFIVLVGINNTAVTASDFVF